MIFPYFFIFPADFYIDLKKVLFSLKIHFYTHKKIFQLMLYFKNGLIYNKENLQVFVPEQLILAYLDFPARWKSPIGKQLLSSVAAVRFHR